MESIALLGLPDLDRLRELLRRIQEILTLGGIALAMAGSAFFIVAWVASHLRRPSAQVHRPVLAGVAFYSAYVPVALTAVAALSALVPTLAPWTLKAFALAIVTAALSWCVGVGVIVAGGSRSDLARARRALLVAGTPWYCLVAYLSTLM